MGNAVAPAHTAASPINTLLSSTTQLDPPLPASFTMPPLPLSETKSNSSPDHSSLDIPSLPSSSSSSLSDLTPQQLLFHAADTGDTDLLRRAVEQGGQVNKADIGLKAQDDEKRAEEEKEGEGRRRRKSKAEVKADKERAALYKDLIITNDTALHKAAARGHCGCIDLLFYLDADLEAANVLGSTPLHRAVSSHQQEAAALLLAKGARLDTVNASGNSPLHVASYQGDVDMAQLLLSHSKADSFRLVVAVNNAGLTPIDYARKKPMHSLLTSHRPALSHISSFVDHHSSHIISPDHAAVSPKHGESGVGLGHYASAGPAEGERPPLPRAGSGGRPPISSHRSAEHGLLSGLHHHHAPNPPLHTPVSRSSAGGEFVAGGDSHAASNVTLLSATSFSSSSSSTTTHPASHGLEHPTLASMPSFEKTSSMDSHPTSRDWSSAGGGDVTVVGPVGEGVGVGAGTKMVELRGDAGRVGNVLPNECPSEEEEKQQQPSDVVLLRDSS